jgi:hypothetical protein
LLHRHAHVAQRLTDNRCLKLGHLSRTVSRHRPAWILF